MGITSIILLVLVCLFGMFIYGLILLVRKRWKLGVILIAPPILVGIIIIIGVIFFTHTTNPDSLNLSIKTKPNDTYHLSGKWKERIDYYSFGTDFVAICTKNNKKVHMIDYIKGDWKPNYYNFGIDIPNQIKRDTNLPEGCVPQLFDISVQKEFSMTFQVENQLEHEPLTLYYVHVREEPMSSAEYWVKPIRYQ